MQMALTEDEGTEILCSVVGDSRLHEILHKPDTEGIDEGEQPLAAQRLEIKTQPDGCAFFVTLGMDQRRSGIADSVVVGISRALGLSGLSR